MDGELLCNDGTSEVIIADGPKSRPEQRKRDDDLGDRDDAGCGVSPNHAVTLSGNGAFAKVDGLLHNQTAGNAITCLAGWIRLHVVTRKNSNMALGMMFDHWMREHRRLKHRIRASNYFSISLAMVMAPMRTWRASRRVSPWLSPRGRVGCWPGKGRSDQRAPHECSPEPGSWCRRPQRCARQPRSLAFLGSNSYSAVSS